MTNRPSGTLYTGVTSNVGCQTYEHARDSLKGSQSATASSVSFIVATVPDLPGWMSDRDIRNVEGRHSLLARGSARAPGRAVPLPRQASCIV